MHPEEQRLDAARSSVPSSQWRSYTAIGLDEVREAWNRNARLWDLGYTDEGDETRRYLSDGPLWRMAGDVRDRDVLDLGCGNGYLCRQLERAGARTTGIDISDAMLAKARHYDNGQGCVRYLQSSASDLHPLHDDEFDLIVSNFVLQDVPDYESATQEMHRVLRAGGRAVVVISHPCFSCGPREWQPGAPDAQCTEGSGPYAVDHYFHEKPYLLDAWEGFHPVPYFHRTLTSYWRAFRSAGFTLIDFDEPVLGERGRSELPSERIAQYDRIPLACIFEVKKMSTGRPCASELPTP